MGRPLRIEVAGELYRVTSRGAGKKRLSAPARTGGSGWRCHAYCEMTNHYHFVLETPDANVSQGRRQFNGVYTQQFNRRHLLVGHLFQILFKVMLVAVERDLQPGGLVADVSVGD